MYLWTWQAGRHSGVTDNPAIALAHAASHLADDVTATVHKVRPELGFHTLSDFYVRTPVTWTARLVNGVPEWSGQPGSPEGWLPGADATVRFAGDDLPFLACLAE